MKMKIRRRNIKLNSQEMRTFALIAIFLIILGGIFIVIAINISAITRTINGDGDNRNSRSNRFTDSNEMLLQNKSNKYNRITDDRRSFETTTSMDTKNENTTTTRTTMATENTELTTKLMMTAHEIEVSTAKPSDFNKNSLQQERRQQQRANQKHLQEQQELDLQQKQQQNPNLTQQRHYKHSDTLDNKQVPCDYAEHTDSIVTVVDIGGNTPKTTATTTTTRKTDPISKGYKALRTPNTSNSVDTDNENESNDPLTLLSTSASTSASTSSTSSTFNVARNGFRDKINISNQQNEFTNKLNDDDDDEDEDDNNKDENNNKDDKIFIETDHHDSIGFKHQVHQVQSTLRPIQKKSNTNIENGLNNNNNKNNNNNNIITYTTNTASTTSRLSSQNIAPTTNDNNNRSNTNVVVDPATSSFFEHVELAESSLSPDKRHELQLHRRKRYLVFPEGSSFQLVFDLIIGIVDYSSYLILGITCSVAWELPSKPPSEIIENFREKLHEGINGLQLRRNDSIPISDIQYVETENKDPIKLATTTTTTTTTTTATTPTQLMSLRYENPWKPQIYEDKSYFYKPKYASEMGIATPTSGIPRYGYDVHQRNGNYDAAAATAPAPDIAVGARLDEAQRKTLNDKAAQWYWRSNRPHPHPDKVYIENGKKKHGSYVERQNFEWQDNDKWKYASVPYVTTIDWQQQQRFGGGSGSVRGKGNSGYHDDHDDDYNIDNVKYDESQQQQHRNFLNWQPKDNRWHRNSQRWQDKQQQWEEYERREKDWNRYAPRKPITNYSPPSSPYNLNTDGSSRTGRQRKILTDPPKHRIYPVFGRKRRSLADLQNESHSSPFELQLERIHFREHLQSRQKLYGKIEQLFQTRGHNGTACVQRALCETGQRDQLSLHHRQHDRQQHHDNDNHHPHHDYRYNQQREPHSTTGEQSGPQSFITELLRAIFALPKDIRSREYESEALHPHSYPHPHAQSHSHSHAGRPSTGYDAKEALELLQREFEAHISWHYRDAHSYDGNCAERFASCEHSIWSDAVVQHTTQRSGGVVRSSI